MSEQPRILFEDTHLIVLSKPPGLLSQPDISGESSLVDWLRGHFGRNYVGGIHRLDRNTSGLMVFAKRTKAAERLTRSLQEGRLVRKYLAILCGELPQSFEWTDELLKDEKTNTVRVVSKKQKDSKLAKLQGKRLDLKKGYSLVEFELETGRSHQIRVQSASRGFPLLGDLKYRGKLSEKEISKLQRPALHSARIEFPHPMRSESGEQLLSFQEEMWDDTKTFWNSLKS